jgi:hypothetical protein
MWKLKGKGIKDRQLLRKANPDMGLKEPTAIR